VKEKQHHRDSSILVTEHTYDALGNRTSTRDHFENVTLFEYDEFGRQTKIIHPKCLSCDGQAFNPTVQYQYDIVGNIVSETDGLGNSTKTTYNIRGQPITITHPDGSKERFEYNIDGTLYKKWEKSGLLCQYAYDGLQRLIQEACYDIDGTFLRATQNVYTGALLTQTIDAMGNITEYQYDGAGRKIAEIQANSRATFAYDSLGRQNITTRWLNEQTYTQEIQEYDVLDRIVEYRIQDETAQTLRKERYGYDIRGNKALTETFIDEQTSSISQICFDTRNRPISIQDAQGNLTTIHNFERYPNPLGGYLFCKTTTDPLGNQTIEVYDPLGRVTTTEKRNFANQRLSYQSLFYDNAGNKELQQDVVYASGHMKGSYVIDWTYDSMGRPLVTTENGDDGSRKVTKHTYDESGRLQTITKPDGVVLSHLYDPIGRLKQLSSSDNTISYLYEYDLNDNLLTSTDSLSNAATQRCYDSQNRLIQETLANDLTLSFSYDGLGRVSDVILPDSTGIRYTYLGVHLSQVARLDSSQNLIYLHSYDSYDLRGLEHQQTLIGNAGTVKLTYDALGRPLAKLAPYFSQVITAHGYDAAGNLLSTTFTDALGTDSRMYTYDDLYQLTSERGGESHSYSYDSICNRLSKDNIAYNLNGLNQITAESDIAYQYDQNGNLIAKITPVDSYRYSYDALNRMISTEGPYGTVFYTYDSFGRRLSQTHNTNTTQYLYQGQCEIGSYLDGELRELRILGKGKGAELGAAIAMETAGKVFAPIHDHFGNVCCLVNSSTGEAEQCYRYTAFGETTSHGIVQNPWQYASKRFDPLTAFHRFGKRDYDCRLGRWLTPDPAGFTDGPNLYAYVRNSTLILFDPWGLTGQKAIGKPKEHVGGRTFRVGELSYCGGIVGILANWLPHERRKLCSKICHDLFSFAASTITEARRERDMVGNLIGLATDLTLPDLPKNSAENNRNDWVGQTHQKIDEVHFTDMAEFYTPEAVEARSIDGPTLCMMPSPGIVLNKFHFNAFYLSKQAQNTIRILRKWAKSKGWTKLPNPNGAPEKWGVYDNGKFEWHLVIKSEASLRPGLEPGSMLPRFDARLRKGGNGYINPISGKIGSEKVGTHIPLDCEW
ncbi:RHS repeat domain-containing protein, partial [Undibacterium sp.]|uniref:RHS repeat domain-containing protein n=1 Tax=Undibacterium sp. TaxID=1914977 RepID=UPI002730FB0C